MVLGHSEAEFDKTKEISESWESFICEDVVVSDRRIEHHQTYMVFHPRQKST